MTWMTPSTWENSDEKVPERLSNSLKMHIHVRVLKLHQILLCDQIMQIHSALFIEKQIKNPAVYGETKVWLHLNGASVSIYMYIVDDPAY